MIQKWLKIDQKWPQNDSKTIRFWINNGSKVSQKLCLFWQKVAVPVQKYLACIFLGARGCKFPQQIWYLSVFGSILIQKISEPAPLFFLLVGHFLHQFRPKMSEMAPKKSKNNPKASTKLPPILCGFENFLRDAASNVFDLARPWFPLPSLQFSISFSRQIPWLDLMEVLEF